MNNSVTRRDMLTGMTTLAAGAIVNQPISAAEPDSPAKDVTVPEFYEWRTLRLHRGPMSPRVDTYLKDAFIPAARRAGCRAIGVFNVQIGPANPSLHVLIQHATIDSFVSLPQKLAQDLEYHKAAADFRTLPATDAPYVNQEVQLLAAFPHFPRVEAPPAGPRIFELRAYRSHGRSAGLKKIEMFDTGGEIAIFRRCGLNPVFFAQTLTGSHLPSLTYMLTFPDLATREKNWNTFRSDPEWKKLSSTPGYTDAEIVTDIDNQILVPTTYSQI